MAKKESKPEDKLLPKKSDASIGAIVIVIKPGEHQGAMMQITVWDSYRGRFTCYNGVHEVKLAQEDLNVLTSEQISIYREGALVTQSAAWIARRSSRHGPVGHAADTEPMVLNIHRVRSHCCLEVLVTTLGGIPISAISCSYDDVVPLTDEQRSLLAKLKGGDGRDAAWVRRATPPALAKAIDVAPTSMFIPDLIAAALGVQIPKVETSEQIWAEMMKQAKNIKFDEKSPVLLSLVTPRPTAAPVTAEAPAQAPERAVIEDAVTLPPAAPDDEENDVHHTDIE